MRKYTVYYTRTINGEVDIEASSPTEAQEIFESDGGKGHEREYEDPVEVYSVEVA
jgi:hypothetical protein